jgi:polyisoprenoid-binding protein YceI
MISCVRIALTALAAAAAIAPCSAAEPSHVWAADPVHSTAQFTATHFGISHVSGIIPITSATISGATEALPASIQASLDPSGVDTRSTDRDNDLKSAHFLDVATYPSMTFQSTSITATGDRTFDLTGNLTLHGVTKSITLKATFLGKTVDPRGHQRVAYEAVGSIKRSDFGMTYGGMIVGDDIALTIDVEAIERQ